MTNLFKRLFLKKSDSSDPVGAYKEKLVKSFRAQFPRASRRKIEKIVADLHTASWYALNRAQLEVFGKLEIGFPELRIKKGRLMLNTDDAIGCFREQLLKHTTLPEAEKEEVN